MLQLFRGYIDNKLTATFSNHTAVLKSIRANLCARRNKIKSMNSDRLAYME